MRDRKNLISVVVSLIVVGTLIYRDYPQVGLWVTVTALTIYIGADLRMCIVCMRHFKTSSRTERIKLAMALSMTMILISAIASGNIYYFLTLVILAVDYMMFSKKVLK